MFWTVHAFAPAKRSTKRGRTITHGQYGRMNTHFPNKFIESNVNLIPHRSARPWSKSSATKIWFCFLEIKCNQWI